MYHIESDDENMLPDDNDRRSASDNESDGEGIFLPLWKICYCSSIV